jgi:hypothetical protein
MAYASLLELVRAVQIAINQTNPNILFSTIPPLLVKKTVRAMNDIKNKSNMTICVSNIPEIMSVLGQDLYNLDEHAVDAIAIGYTFKLLHSKGE